MKQRPAHLILQGKGGIGKSLISAHVIQFLASSQKKRDAALPPTHREHIQVTRSDYEKASSSSYLAGKGRGW